MNENPRFENGPRNKDLPHGKETLDLNSINIIFTGLPGSGKSTIAEGFARRFGLGMFDTDLVVRDNKKKESGNDMTGEEIIKEDGMRPGDIPGKKSFRTREHEAIATLSMERGLVIATGGGAVETEENRDLFCLEHNLIIFISSSPESCAMRAVNKPNKDRPLFERQDNPNTDSPEHAYQTTLDVFRGRFETRKKWYIETADVVLNNDCDEPTADSAIDALVKAVENGVLFEIWKTKQLRHS